MLTGVATAPPAAVVDDDLQSRRDAVRTRPQDLEAHLNLLRLFHARGNAVDYEKAAQAMRAQVGSPANRLACRSPAWAGSSAVAWVSRKGSVEGALWIAEDPWIAEGPWIANGAKAPPAKPADASGSALKLSAG